MKAKQTTVSMNDEHVEVIKRFGTIYNLPNDKVMGHVANLLHGIMENQLEGGKLLLEKDGKFRQVLVGK